MDRLLTFAGHRDPFVLRPDREVIRDGPVLDLLEHRAFDQVLILSTPGAAENATNLEQQIQERHKGLSVELAELDIPDPTDYQAILTTLRSLLGKQLPNWSNENLYVSVASGTPQMHAAWLLLVAGGELPARVLHTRPPQFVTREKPAFEEVDFGDAVFPTVRAPAQARVIPSPPPNLGAALDAVGLVGNHPLLEEIIQTVSQVADVSVPILITGETGTGKEVIARLVHRLSELPHDRFVAINAATLSGDLVDSTLFGHEKGAFTGATERRIGAFERADTGTLFLDEVGELPTETQARLLRTLQDGKFERLGGTQQLSTSARLIAATNRDLEEEIQKGRFRQDLYYRLNTITLRLPPLRERRSDIPKLALHFLDEMNEKYGRTVRLDANALNQLKQASWPGNIRELRNEIERFVLLYQEGGNTLSNRAPVANETVSGLPEPHPGFDLKAYQSTVSDALYARAIELADGNQSEAARLLGVSATAVHKYLQKHSSNT